MQRQRWGAFVELRPFLLQLRNSPQRIARLHGVRKRRASPVSLCTYLGSPHGASFDGGTRGWRIASLG
jgi:hypothetical protein